MSISACGFLDDFHEDLLPEADSRLQRHIVKRVIS